MNTLSLAHIFEYAQCSPTTRNYVEGEQVLNCKYLILCGKFEQVIDYGLLIKLFSLMLFLVVNILFSFALMHQYSALFILFYTYITCYKYIYMNSNLIKSISIFTIHINLNVGLIGFM